MKDFFVEDARQHLDETVQSVFLVQSRQTRTKRNGEPYVALQLADRTGCIDAKLWHHVDIALPIIAANEFLVVRGRVSTYNDRRELVIEKLRGARTDEMEPRDFLPTTEADVDELWKRLLQYLESIQNEALRALLQALVEDEEIATRLKLAPAAKVMHHAYIGGLLEHIVSLCQMCEFASLAYSWVNRDIMLAGALLHDIGKIHELHYSTSLDYSDEGRLIGHINFGIQILRAKLISTPLPRNTAIQLEHLILSHHGSKELGSPVEPSTAEAIIFSQLDNLDAKAHAVQEAISKAQEGTVWTDTVPALRRPIYVRRANSSESLP
jgi:3'-5' exoribonuclease